MLLGPDSLSGAGGGTFALIGSANTETANQGGVQVSHTTGARTEFFGGSNGGADVRVDGVLRVGIPSLSVVGAHFSMAQGNYITRDADILSLSHISTGNALVLRSNGGTTVGTIVVSGSATTYNTVSDYRLKTVDGPLTTSGAFIDALQPKIGEWKAEPGNKSAFFLAHEVQKVSPSSVHGEKDAVDEEGKAVMQSMEYGSAEFIVNIIAELQDLRKRVKKLEGK
jgi:hypothetical protein